MALVDWLLTLSTVNMDNYRFPNINSFQLLTNIQNNIYSGDLDCVLDMAYWSGIQMVKMCLTAEWSIYWILICKADIFVCYLNSTIWRAVETSAIQISIQISNKKSGIGMAFKK